MTVETRVFVSGDKVPIVKSTGPVLGNKNVSADCDKLCTHPRIPPKPSKSLEVEAAPMDGNNGPSANRHSVQELGA